MNILKITFLIGAFLFGQKEVKSQNTISLLQQQEDFKVFRTGIDEMQVGTDWFITPLRFNELCDSVYNSLTDNDNVFTFSNKLRFCLASLKAAHNGINLPDGVVWTKTITLPFILRYIDEQLIIKVNCSPNQNIPNGSEIISINGKSVKEYSNEFLKYCFLNGGNTSLGYQQLGWNWDFVNLLKGLHPASNYDLEIIPFGEKRKDKVEYRNRAL